jgi:hypothetical protein
MKTHNNGNCCWYNAVCLCHSQRNCYIARRNFLQVLLSCDLIWKHCTYQRRTEKAKDFLIFTPGGRPSYFRVKNKEDFNCTCLIFQLIQELTTTLDFNIIFSKFLKNVKLFYTQEMLHKYILWLKIFSEIFQYYWLLPILKMLRNLL